MISGNKGEWSEIYVLLKLLGEGRLYPGDENIRKIAGIVYPVIKILRAEKNGDFEYSVQGKIILVSGGDEVLHIPVDDFRKKAILLLDLIKTQGKGSFSVPEIESFMRNIHCVSLKASSSQKTDIRIVVHDQRTGQQPELGFSIKSQLGGASTLLNAGKTTNFIYKIDDIDLDSGRINEINAIATRTKIKDRISLLQAAGGRLVYSGTEKTTFCNNLVLIDSLLPQILSEIVLCFYSSQNTKMLDLVEMMEKTNPLHFDTSNQHQFYRYKIKRFLTDVALGMMPSKTWGGHYDATGGYLVVKEDGDILCYHLYDKNQFEDYLFNNTKLDTASSSRHCFGEVYEENGSYFFKLNLQIRFIK